MGLHSLELRAVACRALVSGMSALAVSASLGIPRSTIVSWGKLAGMTFVVGCLGGVVGPPPPGQSNLAKSLWEVLHLGVQVEGVPSGAHCPNQCRLARRQHGCGDHRNVRHVHADTHTDLHDASGAHAVLAH